MRINHILQKFLIMMCVLMIPFTGQGIQLYQTVQHYTPAESVLSYQEAKVFSEESALIDRQETLSRLTASIESSASRISRQSGAERYTLLYSFLFLTLLPFVSKCSLKRVCHYICSHTCGLIRILTFMQDTDGRKKIS